MSRRQRRLMRLVRLLVACLALVRVIRGYHAVQGSELCEIPSERAEPTPLLDEPTASFAEGAAAPAVHTASLRDPGAAHAEPTASFAKSAAAPAVHTASLRDPGAPRAEPCIAPSGFTTAHTFIFADDVVRSGAQRVISTLLAQSTTQPPQSTTQPPQSTTQPPQSTTQPPQSTTQPPQSTTQQPQSASAPALHTASLRGPGPAHAEPCIAPGGFTTARAFIGSEHVVRSGAPRVISTLLARSETQQPQSASAPALHTASLRGPGAAHAEPCIAPGGFTTARAFVGSEHVVRSGAERVISTLLARSETQRAQSTSAHARRSSRPVEPFGYHEPPTGEHAVPKCAPSLMSRARGSHERLAPGRSAEH